MRKMPRFRRQLCIERRRHNDAHCSRRQHKTLIAPPEGGALKAETRQPQALGDVVVSTSWLSENCGDAKRSDAVWRQPPDVGPVKEDRFQPNAPFHSRDSHQCGLACAIRPTMLRISLPLAVKSTPSRMVELPYLLPRLDRHRRFAGAFSHRARGLGQRKRNRPALHNLGDVTKASGQPSPVVMTQESASGKATIDVKRR